MPTLVLLIGLAMGTDAFAATKVDWSEYLEPAGSSRPAKAAASPSVTSAAAENKISRKNAKKAKAESRKAKAKAPARTKKGRR